MNASDLNLRLQQAAQNGDLELCRSLVDQGAEINGAYGAGITPLLIACLGGHIEVVRFLIERDADVHATTNDGTTTLIWATPKNNIDLCQVLLAAGVNVNAETHGGWTALLSATTGGMVDMCKLLVRHGASPSYVSPNITYSRLTPFQQAVSKGLAELVRFYVEEAGEDFAQRTEDGKTMMALAGKHKEVKAVLRAFKADASIRAAIESLDGGDSPSTIMRPVKFDAL